MPDQGFIGVEDGWSKKTVIVCPEYRTNRNGEGGTHVYLGGWYLGKIEPEKGKVPWERNGAYSWDPDREDYFFLGHFMTRIDAAGAIIQDRHFMKDDRVFGKHWVFQRPAEAPFLYDDDEAWS